MQTRELDYSFKCFEALITYAIDEVQDDNEYSILKDLEFDEKTFFSKNVYQERTNKENDIIQALRKGQEPLRIIGHPGTGKTTLINKVFCKLKDETKDKAFILYIDFKDVGEINRESNSRYENIDAFIKSKLRGRLDGYLTEKEITRTQIAEYLLDNVEYLKSSFFNNPEYLNIRNKLHSLWHIECGKEEPFNKWFKQNKDQRNNTTFNNLWFNLGETLDIHNILHYIYENGKEGGKRLCIVCFDNVDSIIDNEVRNKFIEFFRNFSSNDKLSAKYMYSIRSENYKVKQLSDAKTYLIKEIKVDYDDFIDEGIFKKRIDVVISEDGFCDEQRKSEIKDKLIRYARAIFAKAILKRRFDYLESLNKEKAKQTIEEQSPDSTISISNFTTLNKLCKLLHDDELLRLALIDLCNNDRREMLVNMKDFIHYLYNVVEINVEDLSAYDNEAKFVLESHFYGWIARKKIFYAHDVYNIPQSVIDWFENKSDSHIDCSLDHLIFSTLYNLCNYSLNKFSYENHTKVGKLITHLNGIGYDSDLIRERLYELYREPEVEETRGLLEISRWFNITNATDISDLDDISLTPRSFYLTSFANLKFINIIARLRVCKATVGNVIFKYDDKLPISFNTLKMDLRFLCRLATMTLNGLIQIGIILKSKHENWFLYYRKTYCVRTNNDKHWNDEYGNLLFSNMFTSHIKFLKRQRRIDNEINTYRITPAILKEYRKLNELFTKKVNEITCDNFTSKDFDFVKALNFKVFEPQKQNNSNL